MMSSDYDPEREHAQPDTASPKAFALWMDYPGANVWVNGRFLTAGPQVAGLVLPDVENWLNTRHRRGETGPVCHARICDMIDAALAARAEGCAPERGGR